MPNTSLAVLTAFLPDNVGVCLHGPVWASFKAALRQNLAADGGELAPESADCPRFQRETLPETAAKALCALDQARLSAGFTSEDGPLPVFFVLDLAEAYPEKILTGEDWPSWDSLEPETVYAFNRFLGRSRLSSGQAVSAKPAEHVPGLFLLSVASRPEPRAVRLLKQRAEPLHKPATPCFYCGIAAHPPTRCPAKHLGIELQALSRLTQMPLHRMAAVFPRILNEADVFLERLSPGLSASAYRDDPELLAFLSFFDLTRIYQPRYLAYLGLLAKPDWPGIDPVGAAPVVHRTSFRMAMDCLRIGDFPRVRQILGAASAGKEETDFYSALCLAFVAMEEGSLPNMSYRLENAAKLASAPEETLYVHLLLSRCWTLQRQFEKALRHVREAQFARSYCAEAKYRKLQVLAGAGAKDLPLADLHKLCTDDWQFFFMAFLDPELVPVTATVDRLLFQMVRRAGRCAATALRQTLAEAKRARAWFDGAGWDEATRSIASAEALRESSVTGSYVGMLNSAAEGEGCARQLARLADRYLDQCLDRCREWARELEDRRDFWANLPIRQRPAEYAQWLGVAAALLEKLLARGFRDGVHSQRAVESPLNQLQAAMNELTRLHDALKGGDGVKGFFRKLWK